MYAKVITEQYVGNIIEMPSFYKWFYKISQLVAVATFTAMSYMETIKNNEETTSSFIL